MNPKTGYGAFVRIFMRNKILVIGEQLKIDKSILNKIDINIGTNNKINLTSVDPIVRKAIKQIRIYQKLEKL